MPNLLALFSRDSTRPPVLLGFRSSTGFIVLSASVAYFQDGFLYGSIIPVLPFSLRERSGVPEDAVQFWNSMFLVIFGVFQVLGGPIVGWWADHCRSHRTPFLFGLLCAFAATTLFMLARSMALLVAARVMQGISAAIVNTLGLALIADTVDKDQLGFWMGLALSGMTLGIVVGPPLAAVVYERAGYTWVFVVALTVIAIDVMLRLAIIEKKKAREWAEGANDASAHDGSQAGSPDFEVGADEQSYGSIQQDHDAMSATNGKTANRSTNDLGDQQHPSETSGLLVKPTPAPRSSFGRSLSTSVVLLSSPPIAAAVYGVLVNATLVTSFDATLPIFVSRAFSWNAERAGAILLALTIVPLLGFIPGALADRYGPARVALTGFAMSTVCIVLMGFIRTAEVVQIVMLTLLLFLTSVGMSLFLSPLAADLSVSVEELASDQPDLIGPDGAATQVYSLFNLALGTGTVAGPMLSGTLYHYAGWFVMCITLAATCFSGSLPVLFFTRGKKSRKGKERN